MRHFPCNWVSDSCAGEALTLYFSPLRCVIHKLRVNPSRPRPNLSTYPQKCRCHVHLVSCQHKKKKCTLLNSLWTFKKFLFSELTHGQKLVTSVIMNFWCRFWLDLAPNDIHWNLADTGWAKSAWSNLFAPWFQGSCVFIHNPSGAKFDSEATLEVSYCSLNNLLSSQRSRCWIALFLWFSFSSHERTFQPSDLLCQQHTRIFLSFSFFFISLFSFSRFLFSLNPMITFRCT